MKPQPKNSKLSKIVDISNIAAPTERDNLRKSVGMSLSQSMFVAPRLVAAGVRSFESIMILMVAMLCAWRYPGFALDGVFRVYLMMAATMAVVMPIFLEIAGLYKLEALLAPSKNVAKIVMVWLVSFAVFAVAILFLKFGLNVSRVWVVTWATSGFFFFATFRFVIASTLRHVNKSGQFNRRAIIVGGGENAAKVIAAIQGSTASGINLVGMFDDRDDNRATAELRGLHKLGNVDDLIEFVRATRIDTLLITLPVTAEDRLMQILNRLWVLPVDIRLSAYGQKLRYRPRAYSYLGNVPCLDVFDRPLGDWGPILKTGVDKIVALLATIMLSPLMLVAAIAIKLESKGPILFKQNRYGFNNELIGVYKFRSMYTDMTDADASKLVSKGDPRVTRVGRFMRKTSLDELPQLFNVLIGDLSLVGPRPHATKAKAGEALYEHVVDGYFARHKVKPGMTGWAQINGWRGETDTAEKIERRVEHDLYYIENWSLWFDFYILARTPFSLINTEQAY
jgi:Undecaprenyl-phosphate glucose phosphotransferase